MALYTQTVKNLVAGISQQPPILRLPEQLEEQINGFSTEMSGLQKRPPSVYIDTLDTVNISDSAEPLVHFVSRDKNEKYIMYFYNGTIKVFDLDGNEKSVSISDGAYINTTKPREDLRIITIADYTFIVNKTKTVAMDGHKTPTLNQGALVHVKQGQYGRTYKIWINGNLLCSYTTPDGSDKSHTTQIDTAYIVQQLKASATATISQQISGIFYGLTIETGDCWLRISYSGTAATKVTSVATQDGFNNQSMIGILDTIQRFSLLPATAPDGYTVKVIGDPNGNSAGSYWVKYDESQKVWKETVQPGIKDTIMASTMPHILVRNSNGTFSFGTTAWGTRSIGDEDSNPLPSFIGEKINDIFFFRNRLGFLAGENAILSESAEYFNFWMTTANDVLDTDPIDVSTTTNSINILNYAVQFNEELYCFSDSTQFILRSDSVFSPKNVVLVNTTGYNSSPDCRPKVCGRNMYFPAARAEYSAIKEYYFVTSATEMRAAQDITAHIAEYIPNDVYDIIPNNNENIILFLTDGDKKSIYVYKYLFQNEQRVQASWSKWKMGGTLYGAFFVGSSLYIVIKRGNKHVLEKLLFTYDTKDLQTEPYRVYLDCKKRMSVANQSYDSVYERTALNIEAEYGIGQTDIGIVLSNGEYHSFKANEMNAGTVYIDGNHVGEDIIIGIPYLFRIDFSTIYPQQKDPSGALRSMTTGRLQMREIKIAYANTGGFIAYVDSHGSHYTYRMTGKKIGKTVLGQKQIDTGEFRIPIQCLNTSYKMRIESDMPLPLSLVSYVWTGSYTTKARGF